MSASGVRSAGPWGTSGCVNPVTHLRRVTALGGEWDRTMAVMQTISDCQMPDCTESVRTMVHLGNDRPWVAVCRPHLDAFATDFRLRATMRENFLN
jgi:hypothetical protein